MLVAAGALFSSIVNNWPFACAMAARDLKIVNKGAMLGLGWLGIRPFVQVAAYVVIVSYVFGARLGPNAGIFDYALYVLSGLIPWQTLQRTLEEAPALVRDRMEILKQVIYPIETLPFTALFASALGPGIVLLVYLVLASATGHLVWSIILIPLPVLLLAALMLGLSWILMIVGTVLKDLREIVSVLLGLMIYFSPVLLSEQMVGARIWQFILLNPLAHVVIAFRDILQDTFHPASWLIFGSIASAAFITGASVINRTKVWINEYI